MILCIALFNTCFDDKWNCWIKISTSTPNTHAMRTRARARIVNNFCWLRKWGKIKWKANTKLDYDLNSIYQYWKICCVKNVSHTHTHTGSFAASTQSHMPCIYLAGTRRSQSARSFLFDLVADAARKLLLYFFSLSFFSITWLFSHPFRIFISNVLSFSFIIIFLLFDLCYFFSSAFFVVLFVFRYILGAHSERSEYRSHKWNNVPVHTLTHPHPPTHTHTIELSDKSN